jgi:hypothetical protein
LTEWKDFFARLGAFRSANPLYQAREKDLEGQAVGGAVLPGDRHAETVTVMNRRSAECPLLSKPG